MLPMAYFVLIRKFQLLQEILGHGAFLRRLLYILHETGPFAFFQFVQQGCF